MHDLFVVDGVADVDVGVEGESAHGGVEVEQVGCGLGGWVLLVLGVEVCVDALDEGRFA